MTGRLIIGILLLLLSSGSMAQNRAYEELQASVRHVVANYANDNQEHARASVIVLDKLCQRYKGLLTQRQYEELAQEIQPMLQATTDTLLRQRIVASLHAIPREEGSLDMQELILDYYRKVPQEMIYLHTDRLCYAAGDTVWFRAHLLDAVTHIPVARSRFVYVELHDQQTDSLVERAMIKCDSDKVFANALCLPDRLKSGGYVLAAYTQWMRNFGADRFFYKQIAVVGQEPGKSRPLPDSGTRQAEPSAKLFPVSYKDSTLVVAQRNGYMYIQPKLSQGISPAACSCVVFGSGNVLVVEQLTEKTLRIDSGSLRPGYITVALVENATGHVLAECLTWIPDTEEVQVKMTRGSRSSDSEPERLDLHVTNGRGEPLAGTFSLSVTDADLVVADTLQPNMADYLSRQSERRVYQGSLQDMLSKHYPRIDYNFETSQTLTGHVTTTFKKHPKNMRLLMVSPLTGARSTYELGDSSRFMLTDLNFTDGMPIILQSVRHNDSESFVQLHVDSLTFPRLSVPDFPVAPQVPPTFREQTEVRQGIHEQMREVMLDEVVKTEKRPYRYLNMVGMEPQRGFKVGDPRIEHASSMAQLLRQLGLRVEYLNGVGRIRPYGAAGLKVFVDDFAEYDHDYILNLLPTDVKSIEYFTPNNASNTIFGLIGGDIGWGSVTGTIPGVLFVFLNDGSEVRRAKARAGDIPSMVTVHQLGYRPSVVFHSMPFSDTYAEPRPTLYWNPKVRGDDTVRFYVPDTLKRLLVTLEGVTDEGVVISRQFIME